MIVKRFEQRWFRFNCLASLGTVPYAMEGLGRDTKMASSAKMARAEVERGEERAQVAEMSVRMKAGEAGPALARSGSSPTTQKTAEGLLLIIQQPQDERRQKTLLSLMYCTLY